MIILSSSIASVADHVYKKFLAEKDYKTVLFIDTAAELEIQDGDDWLIADLKSLEKQGYIVNRFSITDKVLDDIESHIDAHDIIYMSGGNTFYLLDQLQKTNSLDLIRKKVLNGKPYIGTSAGSIMAASDISPTEKIDENLVVEGLANTKGFGFTNLIILPHWGSSFFRDVYLNCIKDIYTTESFKFLLLNDYQYVHVMDTDYLKVFDIRID